MKKIKEYVEGIDDELESAKCYIEKALWYKAKENSNRYNTYKQFAVEDISTLEKVYPDIPQDMMDKWTKSHNEFIERTAWIKQMQNM